MTEPTYHCNLCKRKRVTTRLAVEAVHQNRRDMWQGIAIAIVISLVVAAIFTGAILALLAVFG
jgi:hypothetical protein